MSYAKLFSSITESSLWSERKEVRLLFVSMLARADSTGFVEAAVPGLARMANLKIGEVESALRCLQAPDKHSKNKDNDGRRILAVEGGWMILNYEVYRNRPTDDERREYMRSYMRDYRKRKQDVNNVNDCKHPLAQGETEGEEEEVRVTNSVKVNSRFKIPTVEEVSAYCVERENSVDPERFIDHYTANGWVQGNGNKPIKDWKAAVRTWEKNNFGNAAKSEQTKFQSAEDWMNDNS